MSKGAAKIRLAIAAGLFLAWIGWLAYLVVKTRENPIILARPQFLVADLWVRGHLDGNDNRPDAKVVIREVLWARKDEDKGLVEKQVTVQDLDLVGKDLGWAGPGDYLLPLQKTNSGKNSSVRLTPIPPSPGFVPAFQLITPGKDKDKVAELIVQGTGLDLQTAKEKVEHVPSVLKEPVAPEERFSFEKSLKDLGATFSHEERRIYPATPETLEQLKGIHMK